MDEAEFVTKTTPILEVTCTDSSGVIDLTGAVATLRWADGQTIISRTAQIYNAAAGVIRYRFSENELYAPKMRFEVDIIDSAGNKTSNASLIEVKVRRSLD